MLLDLNVEREKKDQISVNRAEGLKGRNEERNFNKREKKREESFIMLRSSHSVSLFHPLEAHLQRTAGGRGANPRDGGCPLDALKLAGGTN